MSPIRGVDAYNVIYSFDGTLYSHEKEYTKPKPISVDKSQKHNSEWKELAAACFMPST